MGYLAPDRGPRNAYRFSFQDLVLLRAAKALSEARIAPRRIRRALRTLTRQLPAGPLAQRLRISSDGNRVVVRDGRRRPGARSRGSSCSTSTSRSWRRGPRRWPAACAGGRAARTSRSRAEQWYALGVDLESAAPDDARDAYARAMALDPRHASARVNLGRWLQEDGHPAEAVVQYRAALAAQPHHPTAAFNLGTALEELGRRAEAIEAYRQAMEADDGFADAHFNLARLYEQAGKRARRRCGICRRTDD